MAKSMVHVSGTLFFFVNQTVTDFLVTRTRTWSTSMRTWTSP